MPTVRYPFVHLQFDYINVFHVLISLFTLVYTQIVKLWWHLWECLDQ